jgi:hypothetical protein
MKRKKIYANTTPGRVLHYLRQHAEKAATFARKGDETNGDHDSLSRAEIAAALRLDGRLVGDALLTLTESGDVKRSGRRHSYRYTYKKGGHPCE